MNDYADQPLRMRLVLPSDERIIVRARLVYETCDPFAAHIVFHPGSDHSVTRSLARDLLAQGLSQPSGEGDVHIWPTGSGPDAELHLALYSPHGTARLTAPLPVVAQWLNRTYWLVPAGHEADGFDVDAELSQLLSGTG
ncbi:SsgA family sporulation/cell division regulator, partial [Streptomyces sp. NRRL S-813]|uniref:SsgA family sporulation/cell division regulator n=1 Tax=Streptomyces sp. NRRL S-813 TaxID=1463919 RepID=UPI0004C0E867